MTPNEKGKKVLSMYKYTCLEMMIPHTTIYIYMEVEDHVNTWRPQKFIRQKKVGL